MEGASNCPFCLANGLLKGAIIAESSGAYLVDAQGSPGCYLVVPKEHIENILELPDDWWANFKNLFGRVATIPNEFNLSLNIGSSAGQTVRHLHFWIIPRQSGRPSSGKGLARLISDSDSAVSSVE